MKYLLNSLTFKAGNGRLFFSSYESARGSFVFLPVIFRTMLFSLKQNYFVLMPFKLVTAIEFS